MRAWEFLTLGAAEHLDGGYSVQVPEPRWALVPTEASQHRALEQSQSLPLPTPASTR